MMRMVCSGVACGASRGHSPQRSSRLRAGCNKAVVRRSEPSASRSVTGGAGSRQITRNPAAPNAAAAVSPAGPPPETTMSYCASITAIRCSPQP